MSVLHLDGKVAMVGPDGITDHHSRLTPLGLIHTQTLTQRSHKLLLWFRNLKVMKESVINSFKILRIETHKNIQDTQMSHTLAFVLFFLMIGTIVLAGSLVTSSLFLIQVTFGYGDPEM